MMAPRVHRAEPRMTTRIGYLAAHHTAEARDHLAAAIVAAGSRARAARRLGITERHLYRLLAVLGVEAPRARPGRRPKRSRTLTPVVAEGGGG